MQAILFSMKCTTSQAIIYCHIKNSTRMMFIKHYAPNRCLCIKMANSIDHWVEDCRDVTKAGGGGICTKNGCYCENEKSQGEGGVRVDVNGEVKLL